jgi:hypothetical protein
MSNLRKLSRSAHPLEWAAKKRFNRVRRLTQAAMRAKGKGDENTMLRIQHLLQQLDGADQEFLGAKPETAPVFKKGSLPGDEEGGTLMPKGGSDG